MCVSEIGGWCWALLDNIKYLNVFYFITYCDDESNTLTSNYLNN